MDDMTMFALFRARSIACYVQMAKVLATLEPLPYNLPAIDPLDGDPGEMFESIQLAYHAVADLPINHHVKAALRTASLDWLSGMAVQVAGADEDEVGEYLPPRWVLEAGLLSTMRCQTALDFAQDVLEGNIVIPEEFDKDQEN